MNSACRDRLGARDFVAPGLGLDIRRPALAAIVSIGLTSGCGPSLPQVDLELSKNCNEVEVVQLIPRLVTRSEDQVLDLAVDTAASDVVWALVRRPGPTGEGELVVQRVGPQGVELEQLLPADPIISPALSLEPDPEAGRVWVVRQEFGVFELWRVTPSDPVQPVLGSENLTAFPSDGPLCDPCDSDDWPRELFFMDGVPALTSIPPFSVDAGLLVWVGLLETDGFEIRMAGEHRLNFEPPCEDDSTEGQIACEEQNANLRYPEVTVLGKQNDPRQRQTTLFGHRTRAQSFDGTDFPLESADVFMVTLFFDEDGIPAGVLRSYSGFYAPEGPIDASAPPLPSASPPFGMAIDRFASYGLFSNGGVLPRIIQLPNTDPDFIELSGRVPLTLDTHLIQLDLDLAMGRLDEGRWEITKLFPDQPSQSEVLLYETNAPIEQVVQGGMGMFMLRKDEAPPEVVRVRCPVEEVANGSTGSSGSGSSGSSGSSTGL